jgi:thiol-disulfide isomerase/thioredoxin
MSRAPNPLTATLVLSVAAVAIYIGQNLYRGDADTNDIDPPATADTEIRTLPDFSMPDLAGIETSMHSWPGQPLIVNFWATWCAPCLREIPMLMEYQQQHPDAQIVGIAVDSEDAVRDFAAEMPFSYPILVGPGSFEAAAAFGVEYVALPLTVFVAADNRVLATHMGEVHAEQLENFTAANAGLAAGTLDFSAARALFAPQN